MDLAELDCVRLRVVGPQRQRSERHTMDGLTRWGFSAGRRKQSHDRWSLFGGVRMVEVWQRELVPIDGWIIRRPKEAVVNRVPDSELVLVPGGTLITPTPEEGRALALTLARHSIHNIQPDL